jgi:hypothetical protein
MDPVHEAADGIARVIIKMEDASDVPDQAVVSSPPPYMIRDETYVVKKAYRAKPLKKRKRAARTRRSYDVEDSERYANPPEMFIKALLTSCVCWERSYELSGESDDE